MSRRLLVVFASAVLACGGDSSTEPTFNPVGTWNLRSADGVDAPPYTIAQQGTYREEITAEVIVVNVDNTFSDNYTLRVTNGSTVTTSNHQARGTWALSAANAFSYRFDGTTTTYVATVAGDRLTTNFDGRVLVFER